MATNPSPAILWLKRIGLGGLTVILLVTAVTFYGYVEKRTEIENQVNVEVSFPRVGTTDGVYQYHVWLEGAEETTMLHRVEVDLDRVPAYSKTVSVSAIGEGWKPYSSRRAKGAIKGMPDDDVYLRFETDGFGYAKSWSLVTLTAEVAFKFTAFWMEFSQTMSFSLEVPGPHHRRQEGSVNKSIKWTSTDIMPPEHEWETITESQ